jgi:flagellar basal body-associated protein FliL
MHNLLSNALHIFIIFMIVVFIVSGIMAITGTFDHWGSRYILKRRRKRLLRNKRAAKPDDKGRHQMNASPYYSSNPERTTTADKGRYA